MVYYTNRSNNSNMTEQDRQQLNATLINAIAEGALTTPEAKQTWANAFDLLVHEIVVESGYDGTDREVHEEVAGMLQQSILKNARARREFLDQQAA